MSASLATIPATDIESAVPGIVQAAAVLSKLQENARENTQGKGTPKILEAAELLDALKESVSNILAIVELARQLNQAGKRSPERSQKVVEAIMPSIITDVTARLLKQSQSSGIQYADLSEYRLYKAYTGKHGEPFPVPAWMSQQLSYLHVTNRLRDLPSALTYLYYSPAAQGTEYAKQERCLNDLHTKLQQTESGTQPYSRIVAQIEACENEIDAFLVKAQDVDPCLVPECREAVNIEVAVNDDIVLQLIELYKGIGTLVEALIPDTPKTFEPHLIQAFYIVNPDGSSEQAKPYITDQIDAQGAFKAAAKNNLITQLVELYLDLRDAIAEIRADYLTQHHNEQEHRATLNALSRSLESIFPQGIRASRELLLQLNSSNDKTFELVHAKLLSTKVMTGRGNLELFIDQPENIALLEQSVKLMILGSEATAQHLVTELSGSKQFESIAKLCSQTRRLMESNNVDRLALYFDQELQKLIEGKSMTFAYGTALVLTLLAVSENPKIRKALRGRIKRIEEIPNLINSIAGVKGAEQQGKFLERLRVNIAQRFEDNLSNYWGHKAIVAELRRDIAEHLLLLKHRKAHAGLPSKKVFKNGHVFYGPPGSGKTYLGVCAANDFGLPYLKISREEMAKAYSKPKEPGTSESSLEETLSQFLDAKVAEAEKLRLVSGAPAAILMIDEMEAEFLRRNPESSPRSELIATNIMLRVIERAMAKYPEIIFIAATNHIDLVDPAALRIGRYGFGKYIGAPDKESRIDIICGTLNELGFEDNQAQFISQAGFADLVEESDGLMPEPISLAINHHICVARAKALEDGQDISAFTAIPYAELKTAIALIKAQTNIKLAKAA